MISYTRKIALVLVYCENNGCSYETDPPPPPPPPTHTHTHTHIANAMEILQSYNKLWYKCHQLNHSITNMILLQTTNAYTTLSNILDILLWKEY